MAEFTLPVKIREQAGKDLERMRKQGEIPAVMYGHGLKPQMFWVQYVKFSKLYEKAGESSIIEVTPEKGTMANVIINDVQLDPLTSRFSHIDFFQVRMDEKLEAHIPIEFVGEAPAVREMGGIFVKPVDQILVSCLPKDLPHSFVVDISVLQTFENHIQIKDLNVPAGVTILTEADTTIALVEAPRTEAEMAALDEKVEADVTKVEGVVKEEAPAAAEEGAGKDAKPAKTPEEKK